VMLSHANLIADALSTAEILEPMQTDRFLSVLPLHHALEFTGGFTIPMYGGSAIHYIEHQKEIAETMKLAEITVVIGVPRLFQVFMERIREKMAAAGAAARFKASIGQTMAATWEMAGSTTARKRIFKKVHEGFGGKLRLMISGGAALDPEVFNFFKSFGITIVEGYGLTETAPVLTVNPPHRIRFGSVGPPLPNVEIRIADDGEILARGPNVMLGYFNRPQLTAESIVDGWFHTGDVGRIDAEGCLHITDRKKEIIVTSGGKKVAPQPIEAALRGQSVIGDALVIGDRQRFPAVLVLPRWAALAAALGEPVPANAADRERLAALPGARACIQTAIDAVNAPLAQFEKLKSFGVIVEDFSIAGGELTPTLKIKRRVIVQRYAAKIAAIYSS